MNIVRILVLLFSFMILTSCQSFSILDQQVTSLDKQQPVEKQDAKTLQFFTAKEKRQFRNQAVHEQSYTTDNKVLDELELSNEKSIESQGRLPAVTAVKKVELNLPETFNPDEIVQLDYEQIEIRQILQELADALGLSIVIDPSIQGKITMRTSPNQPLRQKDLWPVLNMLLNESGITMEKKAGLYYVKKNPLQLPKTIGYPSLIASTSPSIALQLTPLSHISVNTALEVIKPLLNNKVKITQIPTLNMLAITGSSEQLLRLNGLISLVDVDTFKHRGIRLYKIREADAKNIANELNDILKLIDGKKSSYEVLGLERINAVLVVAPPRRGFKEVKRWINILDEATDYNLQEQVFIYHCKSVKCDSLSSTLNSIFNQENKKTGVKKTDIVNKENVFKTVPKDALNVNSKKQPYKKNEVVNKQINVKNNLSKPSADINVTIVADSDTNTLIMRTTGKDYRSLLETIQLLDRTPLQVLVNAVLAQVSLDKSQSLGVDWKYQTTNGLIQSNLGKASAVVNGSPLGLILSGVKGNLSASLNALITAGDVNILSRPSLLISNNQEGIIKVGQEVPVQTSATTNLDGSTLVTNGTQVTQEISYRTTGIELTVTPHINEDGMVTMEISQSLSAIEGSTNSQDVGFKPTFTNQDLTTTAIVADGETIILGGLIDTVTSYNDTGLPLLKDLPFAGTLFRTREESLERRELMLIITPRIIGPDTDLQSFNHEFMARFRSLGEYMEQELQVN